MDNQQIKIRLKSFDHRSLEKATKEIVFSIKRAGADVSGPIPLPRKIERFTLNKSPHIDKKSREQFEIRRQSRLIIINYPNPQAVEVLKNINLPSGVEGKVILSKSNE